MIYKLGDRIPKIGKNIFMGDTVRIIGEVEVKDETSIWYGSTLRGDVGVIKIGSKTNIQENTVIHAEKEFDVIIGERVTVGHCCLIHGTKIGDDTLVGMGSTLTDGVIIPKNCFISANSMVTSKIGEIPEGSFIKGNPAKVIGPVSEAQKKLIEDSYVIYDNKREKYLSQLEKIKID